jgi:hypothetical protein
VPYFTVMSSEGKFRAPKMKSYVRGTDDPDSVGVFNNDQLQKIGLALRYSAGSSGAELNTAQGIAG